MTRETRLTDEQRRSLEWLAGTVSGHLWVDMPEEHVRPLMSLRDVRDGRRRVLRTVRSRSFSGVAVSAAGRAALATPTEGQPS